jgi:two-component system, chemotaxis family, sensor kinase CheA
MSDYLDPNNEELLQDFFAEAETQVELLESSILVLENDPGNRDAIDEIFRAAHTLKGASATVQMDELSGFTHLVEDVFDQIRESGSRVTGELVDVLLAAVDVIKAMLASRSDGEVYAGDFAHVIDGLKSAVGEGGGHEATAGPTVEPDPAPRGAIARTTATSRADGAEAAVLLSQDEIRELYETADGDSTVFQVRVEFDE